MTCPSFNFFLCGHSSVRGATCPGPREALASALERARQNQGVAADTMLKWRALGERTVEVYLTSDQSQTRYTSKDIDGFYVTMEVYR